MGDEQTLKAICEEMDWDFDEIQAEVEKMNEEANLNDAMNTLEGVVTDEQTAETGSTAIPE